MDPSETTPPVPASSDESAFASTALALERTLVDRGLSLLAARAVLEIGESLRQRTLATGVELGAMVSARTGRRVGRDIRGSTTRVTVAAHLKAMVPGHPYVQIHTHPGNAAPSDADGFTLVGVDGIVLMVIVGVDRSWYLLSKGPAFAASGFAVAKDVASAFLEARGEHDADSAWRAIAGRFGLRYDRV